MSSREDTGVALYVHCDPVREEYFVTGEELLRLSQASQNYWKDFGLPLFFFGLPWLVNGLIATGNPTNFDLTKLTGTIVVNYLVGIIGIILGLVFICIWLKTKDRFRDIITVIRAKPLYRAYIPPSSGSSPEIELTPETTPQPPPES